MKVNYNEKNNKTKAQIFHKIEYAISKAGNVFNEFPRNVSNKRFS